MLDRAEQAVDRVVTDYDDDQAIFELAATELRDQLDQQRKRSELAEKRTAEAIHGRERLQHARRAAEGLVASRVADRPLTEAIRSEERRGGKEGGSTGRDRGWPRREKKKR